MNNINLFVYKDRDSVEIIECEHFVLCSTGDLVITGYDGNERIERTIKNGEFAYFGAWGK